MPSSRIDSDEMVTRGVGRETLQGDLSTKTSWDLVVTGGDFLSSSISCDLVTRLGGLNLHGRVALTGPPRENWASSPSDDLEMRVGGVTAEKLVR